MVVEDAVGKKGIELPLLRNPGPGLGMRDLQRGLLPVADGIGVGRLKEFTVFLGTGADECQAADIVQQFGEIGFLGMGVGSKGRNSLVRSAVVSEWRQNPEKSAGVRREKWLNTCATDSPMTSVLIVSMPRVRSA